MKYQALIVAGGSGNRMNSGVPKQFLLLDSKPVLMHTIEAFYHSDLKPEITVVINPDFYEYWEGLCIKYDFNIPHQFIRGGTQRFDSVKNGLESIKGTAIIAIHDAVRPLASNSLITKSFREAEEKGNAVPGITSSDSIRQIQNDHSITLDRGGIFLIQTPQVFHSEILRKAYQQSYNTDFTDDASVVEKSGVKINIIQGEKSNLKITYPEDIKIAEVLLKI